MAKYTLTLEDDFNFDLIGLCSHEGDYRVCWSINEQLGLQLQKSLEPYMVSGKKGKIISKHSFFEWFNEEDNVEYYFIKNKSQGNYLIPEKSQIDFFLAIKEAGIIDVTELLNKLRGLNCVLTAFYFDPNQLKSASRFIF